MGDKILHSVFWLLVLYLLIKNANPANNILNAIGNAYRAQVNALQGN